MGADYSKAVWLPCKNFWPGGNSMQRVVIHGTASNGPQTGYQLATGAEFNDGQSASVTYINDVDGTVYQIVQESDSHWGNCCITGTEAPAGYYPIPGTADYHLHGLIDTGQPGAVNMNHSTIAIENVKHDCCNADSLTSAQYNSLVSLVADICHRRGILPVKGSVIGHFDLDPVNRARCPGTFDWPRFYTDLQIAMGFGPMLPEDVHALALSAGFTEDQASIAVAICHAESGLMRYRQGIVADGSLDRGLCQFNSHWHMEVRDAVAYDPALALKEMYRISKQGTDFSSWNTYKDGSYMKYITVLTSSGEVAVYPPSYQLEAGETEDACGFFSNALAKAMGKPPSTAPSLDTEGVDQLADKYYTAYNGANVSSNQNGMSIPQQEGMLKDLSIPFTHMAVSPTSDHNHDVALISAWVRLGYPVIVTIPESSVYDMDLGGGPYPWVNANPSAWSGVTHIMTVTGIDTRPGFTGHLKYRDTVNPNGSDHAHTYSNDHIVFYRAIAINPPWLPQRADGFDPLVNQGGSSVGVPSGWTVTKASDGSDVLHNPVNSITVGGVFAKHIESANPQWPGFDVPVEDGHPVDVFEQNNPTWFPGGGSQQTFRNHMLAWVKADNSVREEFMGPELLFLRKKVSDLSAQLNSVQSQLASETSAEQADQTQIASLTQQISSLQAQLLAAQQQGGSISPAEQSAINNAVSALKALQQFVK